MNISTQVRPSSSKPAAVRRSFRSTKTRYLDQSLPSITRQRFWALCLSAALIGASFTGHVHASDYILTFPNYIQINGPDSPASAPSWLVAMKNYRTQQQANLNYDGSIYQFSPLKWTQHNPIQPQAMAHDRFLYDVATGKYTVDKYLVDVRKRYGGIDSILIWPVYPNLGVDSRNSDQLIRDMPGFPTEVKKMVEDFHKNGVKVLFPFNPWDNGTHYPGGSWSAVLPATMAEIGADGLNGDTLTTVDNEFFENSLTDKRPLALEPELGCGTGVYFDGIGTPPQGPVSVAAAIQWNTMGWGYWQTPYTLLGVSLPKWFEPRFTVHVNDRWSKSKIAMLQAAFFNGTGLESWENIWGTWNQLTDRDGQAIRCVASIERKFPDLLISRNWEPYTPTINSSQVFASKWPSETNSQILWTLVNVGTTQVDGYQICVPYRAGVEYYDLWHGVKLNPTINGGTAFLAFSIEGSGYAAILATTRADMPVDFRAFLSTMHRMTAKPLSDYSAANTVLTQTVDPNPSTKLYSGAPSGMIKIPGGRFQFVVEGTEIEGTDEPGVDVQYPWESQPSYTHSHQMTIRTFYLDRTEVTNLQYQVFMDATGYRPADMHNFLKDWSWSIPAHPHYKEGWDNKPVTWVSAEDARAYASWAGRRLPNEWEWQYAAQGTDGRLYPWGNTFSASNVPPINTSRDTTPPADVMAYPGGASPFGVLDMVGNVWQWTNTFSDQHTRAATVRGGSPYEPQTARWYFPWGPTAYQLNHHNKYLLMAPSLDRSAEIGFRTAADAPAETMTGE
jgi:iron(II)-dependent oxidoreductase